MKKFPIVLFSCGILIQLAALFGEHAEEIPAVVKVIAPAYYHANNGLKHLISGASLAKHDEGFRELSELLSRDFKERNHVPEHIKDITLDKIWYECDQWRGNQPIPSSELAVFSISTTVTKVVGPGGTNGFCHIEKLRGHVEELKGANILYFCFGMFFVGTVVEIVAFFIESKESHHPSAAHK